MGRGNPFVEATMQLWFQPLSIEVHQAIAIAIAWCELVITRRNRREFLRLRGPAAILVISSDTSSNAIAKRFRACCLVFIGYWQYHIDNSAKWVVAQNLKCACVS